MKKIGLHLIAVLMLFYLSIDLYGSIPQKNIVVIIPSRNNSQWYKENVKSVIEQKYSNYRVIYIDDCSTDNTYQLVTEYVKECGAQDKVTVLRNDVRYGAMANIYAAIYTCNDNDIIVLIDGDDWLAHDKVLARINAAYVDPNIWLTYGQFKCYPDGRLGECKDIPAHIIQNNVFREYDWCSSHLRTFYAGLFKKIKIEDLMYDGNFYDVTWDRAFMYPMLEMCGNHFMFIPDVLYVYNCDNASNDFKTKLLLQIACSKQIACKVKYQPLSRNDLLPPKEQHASVIVFSSHGAQYLRTCLSSIEKYVSEMKDIYVLYSADDEQKAYDDIKQKFHAHYEECDRTNFKDTSLCILAGCSEYVLCVSDIMKVHDAISLASCMQELRTTQAYGFYLALGKNIRTNKKLVRDLRQPPLARINNNLYAWQFMYGEHDWRQEHTLSMALYRTKDLLAAISDLNYDTPETLQASWSTAYVDLNNVGLIYATSKASYN